MPESFLEFGQYDMAEFGWCEICANDFTADGQSVYVVSPGSSAGFHT
jgi:hypothetical protein